MDKHKNPNFYVKDMEIKQFDCLNYLQVQLGQGLNVVVGANGSGKSNFITALRYAYRGVENVKFAYKFQLSVQSASQEIELIEDLTGAERLCVNEQAELSEMLVCSSSIRNNQGKTIVADETLHKLVIQQEMKELYPFFEPSYVPSVTFDYYFSMLNVAGRIIINQDNINNDLYIHDVLFAQNIRLIAEVAAPAHWAENSDFLLQLNPELLRYLADNSYIKSLRLSNDLNISHDNSSAISINGLLLEFLVHGQWLKWQQLSEGTQRFFLIVVALYSDRYLALIDDIEQSIYPQQLQVLLQLVKQKAAHKQVILTTHSPQVLDTLTSDNLGSIIMAHYDLALGTQMQQLSEATQQEAQRHLDSGGRLSDFWLSGGF